MYVKGSASKIVRTTTRIPSGPHALKESRSAMT